MARASEGVCSPLQSFTYDTWGNGWVSSYNDAENRMISSMLDSTTVYQYDGEGRRVAKTNCPSGMSTCTAATPGASTVWYVYDAAGNLAVEYGQSTMAAALPCTTCYLMQDHLGSTRVMTDQNGTAVPGGCHDYLPFGEEIYAPIGQRSTSCYPAGYKPGLLFTGQLRDAWGESQLDYFGARYMSSAQGRFTSADEPFADQHFSYPQSWNLYVYGRNNPVRFFDLDGRRCVQTDDGGWADDGSGGGCEKAGVAPSGNIEAQQVQVQDYEPPSPLLLAVALGARRAGPAVNAAGIATGVVLTGGALGAGATAIGGGAGLVSLSIGATRAAQMVPLLLPAGPKLSQVISRLGAGQQNPQLVLQKLTELRDAAVAARTYAQGFYIQSGVTIYRVGQDYLTVSGQGRVLSYVQNAKPGTGVVVRYLEMGGK